jgi:hypothetical protein
METFVLIVDDEVAATYRAADLKAALKIAGKRGGTLQWLIWRRDGKVAGVREATMHEHAAWRAYQVGRQLARDENIQHIEALAVKHGISEKQVVAALHEVPVSKVRDRSDYDPDECMLVDFEFMRLKSDSL